jgi:hypothetical protein
MMRALALAVALLIASSASGDARSSRWVRERGTLEWVIGAGSWRTSLGADPRVPGFDAIVGGGEILLGLDVYSGLGIIIDGRFLGGVERGARYLEGLGGLGLQLRVNDWVRLRAGAAAGQALMPEDTAVLVGGFLACSIDLFALGPTRAAFTLSVRLDIDAMIGAAKTLPDQSLALALGLGLRY